MNWTPERIKALRENKPGRTQAEFGKLIGLSRIASVSALERGVHKPNPQTVLLLNMLYEKEKGEKEPTPLESAIEEEEEPEPAVA